MERRAPGARREHRLDPRDWLDRIVLAPEQHRDVAAERLVVERGIQAAQDRLDEAERAPAAGESLDELHAGKVLHRTGHCLGRAAVDVDVATRLRSAQPLNEAPQLARALMGEDEI